MEGQNNGLGPNIGVGSIEKRTRPVGESNEGEALNMGDRLDNPSLVPTNVEMDSDYDKLYEYESEAFNSLVFSEDEGRTTYDSFSEDTEYGEVVFKVGQIFSTMELFKMALKDYLVFERKDMLYIENEKHKLRTSCAAENCPWLILTSWNSSSRCFQEKTSINEHTCARDYGSNMADRDWVASKLIKRLHIHPEMKSRQEMDHMIEEYNVQLNPKMIARALKVDREVVVGNAKAQYAKVRDYLMELHWSYYGGQLLSTVIQDANNHLFVIAYAIIPNEFKDTWKWFLTLLQEDLGKVTQHGLNFISDQQKGMELVIKEVMPNANHINYVLHIWKNFIKHFKDQQTKQIVWECARCTTFQEFNRSMEKMKQINLGA
ncbi:uncharacterized protein LOC107641198 [Arachis ipaensis]|uniref:uncharacterized protein LOC107641198 n=1 Tax=Arachis ipaensis TaxID=130454 RepID=UPI0007AF0F28|nr:uncharacterized protein LOC107641198 [Arachis ipaensis]